MNEHYSNDEEYKQYLEWKKEKDAPTLKPGDSVIVPRSDGSIDNEGWRIKYIYPDDSNETMIAVENQSKKLRKDLPLSKLIKYNQSE